jgi:hypothetical protein
MVDKPKNDMTKFRNIVRGKAREERSFYATVEVLKKMKFKHGGKTTVDKPVFTVLFNVIESNLPMPANAYNPVFMFKRTNPELVQKDGKWVPQGENDDYIGTPSPEQYFTLPDYDNGINADAVIERDGKKVIGDYYLASMFLKTFESAEVADDFIKRVMKDLEAFLAAMTNYMTEKKTLFEWEGYHLAGATKATSEIKLIHTTVASFTEKSSGPEVRPVRQV